MRNFIFIAVLVSLLVAEAAQSSQNHGVTPAEAVPGEFVVKLKNDGFKFMSAENIGRVLGGVIKSRFDGDPSLFVLKKDPSTMTIEDFDDLARNPDVEIIEPNYVYHLDLVPNDPDFPKMWGFQNSGEPSGGNFEFFSKRSAIAGMDINITKAWDLTTGSSNVVVAVIDTGIDLAHPDLKDNLWVNEAEANGRPGVDDEGNGYVDDVNGWNFYDNTNNPTDDHGHGSHVSGIIGAKGNDNVGIAGMNWNVKLMALKFLSADGSGTLEGAIKAIDYATKMGAKIMSNSWGGGGYSKNLENAVKRANKAGILFVAAAGNDGVNNDVSNHYPANFDVPNVISVAAIDNSGALAEFSDYGVKKVHVAAPGVDVYSAFKEGGYTTLSGTSMATPHVSGLAALILSREKLSAVQLKNRIMKTTRPLETLHGKVASGGLIDAYAALTKKKAKRP